MIGVTRSLTRLKTDHRSLWSVFNLVGVLFPDSIRNYMTKQLSNDWMIEKEPGQGEPLVVGHACVCCQAMAPSHWQEGHHLQAGIQSYFIEFSNVYVYKLISSTRLWRLWRKNEWTTSPLSRKRVSCSE